MKLRNKKTGEVGYIDINVIHTNAIEIYNSFDLMFEEWEEYKPKEPLIKDLKIRKAVRAWAEAVSHNNQFDIRNSGYAICTGPESAIDFNKYLGLKDDRHYTIEELCGSEECEK